MGTVYKLTDSFSVFAQLSQGYKAPDYMSLYSNVMGGSSVTILPNDNLKPEESQSYEFGFRGTGSLGGYEVTAFYTDYQNFIDMVTIESMSVYQAQNLDDVTIKGIEFKGQLWLDEAINAPEGTILRGSLAWAEGKDKENDEYLNSVAPLTAVVGVGYDAPSELWGTEMVMTLVKGKKGSRVAGVKEDDQFNPAGYGIVDLTGYYNPTNNLVLRAGLFNLTDKKYWNLNDVRDMATDEAGLDRYAQPGRNVSVNMTYTF